MLIYIGILTNIIVVRKSITSSYLFIILLFVTLLRLYEYYLHILK